MFFCQAVYPYKHTDILRHIHLVNVYKCMHKPYDYMCVYTYVYTTIIDYIVKSIMKVPE